MTFKLGSNGPDVVAWQQWFNRAYRSYAPRPDGYYGYDEVSAVSEMQRRLSIPVTGEFDDATAAKAGYRLPGPTAPPPPAGRPRGRHLALVYRGTGGIIGLDYVSRVCQGAADLVEEINPDFPATMGGLPVGAAGGIGDVSMNRAVDIAVANSVRIIDQALAVNPNRRIVVGGYSAGAVAAAKVRQYLHENHPDNYLCSFSLGDPTRPYGGAYYKGPILDGQGIGSWRYGDTTDYRHCWLAHPADMYTNIPLGQAGDIMDDCYDLITAVQLSDPLGTAWAMLQRLPDIIGKTLGTVPAPLQGFATDPFSQLIQLPFLTGLLQTGHADLNKLTGPGAAIYAAVVALRFLAAGTGPHITYEWNEAWPGMTMLGLAIQHVRDWAALDTGN